MTYDDVLRGYILKSGIKQPKVSGFADGMASVDGRWVKVGSRLPSGWVVNGYNGKDKAQLSYGGVPFEQDMGLGTVSNWEAPATAPATGVGSESEGDEERMRQMLSPVQNADGKWTVPQFNGQVFDSIEEAEQFAKRYGVTDRTSIDKFIQGMSAQPATAKIQLGDGTYVDIPYSPSNQPKYGTLSDFFNLPLEERAKGMKIYNNETGDFTDDFKHQIPPLEYGDDGYIK